MLGAPEWNVYLTERGGERILLEIPYSAFYCGRRINNIGNGSVEIAGNCCDFITDVLPAAHEIVAYRDGVQVWAGPVTDLLYSSDNSTIGARDLGQWFDWRLIMEDCSFQEDVSSIFRTLVKDALALDPSPNIDVHTQDVGIIAQRAYRGKNKEVVGDKLRELTRTALDFTMRGRTIFAGGLELLLPSIMLTDPDVRTATVQIDGLSYATEVYVIGAERLSQGSTSPSVGRTNGMAERGSEVYGRIQRSYVESDIKDDVTAALNARSRLESVQPSPMQLNITLDSQCSVEYQDLIPGCRVDLRVAEGAGCVIPFQDYRLTSVSTGIVAANEGSTEYTNLTMTPVGLSDDEEI